MKHPPTPITLLTNSYSNNNIYIKREDLLPFSFGGNKVRIAEKYIEDMKKNGKNCMIAYGNTRSNLCRVISNICKAKNIPCFVISPSDESGERFETNNNLMVKSMEAIVVPTAKSNVSETVSSVFKHCKSIGLDPYYIYGNVYGEGNEEVAIQAYDEVYDEILNQEKELEINFDYIFLACGTGTTLAGLVSGNYRNMLKHKIIGVSTARVAEHANKVLNKYLNIYLGDQLELDLNKSYEIVDEYLFGGYGLYTSKIIESINDILINEGIPLDTTYTGKAFYGMQQYINKNNIQSKNILFLHTGGTPLFFDKIDEIL